MRPSEGEGARKALLVSLVSLAVPITGAALFPDWIRGDVGLLLWILPIAPAFLLSYYHGWKGASAALAGGMAAFATGESLLILAGSSAPPVEWTLGAVLVLLAVALGSGWISEVFHDALRRAHEEALTDIATGLPNRRAATNFLEKAFAAAKRGGVMSVVLFDLDHFKAINDTHGHAAGDHVLRAFASILEDTTRTMNVSGRYGGEEFISILLQSDAAGAAVFAEHVRTGLASREFGFPVTVSAGVAQYESGMASPDVLVAAADQALYRAKTSGRDRVATLEAEGRRPRPAAPPDRPDAGEAGLPGSGERILVVDDDDAARSSLARALRRMGYSVLEADSAQTATSIVRGLDEPLDLLVTDIVMPDIGGFRLVEMIEEIQRAPKVVYVSGYDQEEVDWAGVPGRSSRFISKPVMIDDLTNAASDLLRERTSDDVELPPAGRSEAPSPRRDERASAAHVVLDLDGTILREARIAVACRNGDAGERARAALVRAGFREVERVAALDEDPASEADLLVVELDAAGVPLEPTRRDGGSRPGAAVLGLSRAEDRTATLERFDPVVGQVLPLPLDEALLASTARDLLRIVWLIRERARDAERFNARLAAGAAELHESRMDLLRRLARAAEYRDELTGQHAERVGRISGVLAERLGWSVERRRLLEESATLHDLGKVAVPDALLKKAGRFTDEERRAMQEHTRIGAEMLAGSRSPLLDLAREIALTHHERWDGKGYPNGLSGVAIPEAGRIVAVADTYDTMTHRRPYREPIETSNAVNEVASQAGRQFDPRVVDAFVDAYRQGHLDLAKMGRFIAWPDGAVTSA